MDSLTLLHGPHARKALEGPDVTVYAYALNRLGMYMLLGAAGILYVMAAWIWFGGHATTLPWQIGLGSAFVIATVLSILVTYYNHIAEKRVVAISDETLMVGEVERLWVIDWSILDVESVGLKDMELSRASAGLQITAGGQDIKLLLYSPFARLADPQGFMFEVLSKFQEREELEDESGLAEEE